MSYIQRELVVNTYNLIPVMYALSQILLQGCIRGRSCTFVIMLHELRERCEATRVPRCKQGHSRQRRRFPSVTMCLAIPMVDCGSIRPPRLEQLWCVGKNIDWGSEEELSVRNVLSPLVLFEDVKEHVISDLEFASEIDPEGKFHTNCAVETLRVRRCDSRFIAAILSEQPFMAHDRLRTLDLGDMTFPCAEYVGQLIEEASDRLEHLTLHLDTRAYGTQYRESGFQLK